MSQLRTLFLLICAAAVLFLDCGPTMIAGGSGSEVVGSLVDGNGKAVIGAEVILDTAISDTTPAMDSAAAHRFRDTSDAQGNFNLIIQSAGGTYNLVCVAKNPSLVYFKSGIKNDRPSNHKGIYEIDVGRDTMLPPGKISGKVVINSTTTENVTCYVPGTSFMAMSDSTGAFTIFGVPPGTYNVYYYITGYETGKDNSVTVISNQVTVLPVMVLSLDPTGAPQPPAGLSSVADTAAGIVRLSWRAVHVSDLAGYIVCRKDSATANYVALDTLVDTFFVDSVYRNILDITEHDYSYEVKALDSGTNASAFSAPVPIHTVPPSYVRPVIQLSRVSPLSFMASAGDTVKIAADFRSSITRTDTLFWFTKAPDSTFIKKTDVYAIQGSDTLSWVWNNAGVKKVYVNALDDRGITWRDSLTVNIQPAPINVIAVKSTDSTVTVIWHRSTDPAFTQYQLFAGDSTKGMIFINPVAIATISSVTDTTYTTATWKNGIKKYCVEVVAVFPSVPGAAITGGIKNTPPRITTDTTAIPKAANAGVLYHAKLAVADANKDSISFAQLSSNAGLTISDSSISWTPGVSDTGMRHISVRVSDGWGGGDTISWDVLVRPSDLWSSFSPLSKARRWLSAAVINGVLYAAGGCALYFDGANNIIVPSSAVEAYSLASGTAWSPVASLPTARYLMTCAPLGNNLFCFGGAGSYDYVMTVDSLNPVSNSWGTAAQLSGVRVGAAVCAVGGKFYLIGGQSYTGVSSTVNSNIDEWDPASGWTPKVSMKQERMDHQAVAVNNKIYIIGGVGGSSDPTNCGIEQSVEVFDPAINRVDTAASLNTGRRFFGAAEANGKIYAIGGLSSLNSDTLASVEEYDPVKNTWSYKAALPTGRFGCAAASWQGRIYLVGGAEKTATTASGTKDLNSVTVYYP
jgi:hypothetical protein